MVSKHNSDYVHVSGGNDPTTRDEDVLFVGEYDDYTGEGTRPRGQVMYAGVVNEEQGTDADYLGGARVNPKTDRGKNAPLYRQRPKLRYFERKFDDK